MTLFVFRNSNRIRPPFSSHKSQESHFTAHRISVIGFTVCNYGPPFRRATWCQVWIQFKLIRLKTCHNRTWRLAARHGPGRPPLCPDARVLRVSPCPCSPILLRSRSMPGEKSPLASSSSQFSSRQVGASHVNSSRVKSSRVKLGLRLEASTSGAPHGTLRARKSSQVESSRVESSRVESSRVESSRVAARSPPRSSR